MKLRSPFSHHCVGCLVEGFPWLLSVLSAVLLEKPLGQKAYAVSSIIYTALSMCQAVHFIHGVTAEEASSKEKLEKRKLQKSRPLKV